MVTDPGKEMGPVSRSIQAPQGRTLPLATAPFFVEIIFEADQLNGHHSGNHPGVHVDAVIGVDEVNLVVR